MSHQPIMSIVLMMAMAYMVIKVHQWTMCVNIAEAVDDMMLVEEEEQDRMYPQLLD